MQIRQAIPEDSKALGRVQLDSWRTMFDGIASDAYMAQFSYEQREASWQRFLTTNPAALTYVAENDAGELIGYIQASRRAYQGYETEIDSVHIDAAYRGQGLGQQLVAAVARHLHDEGYHSLMLWVIQNNRARHFYERLGGELFDQKPLNLGKTPTTEVAYGWSDITRLF